MANVRVLDVTLYTREGCHLCDCAFECLQSALRGISHSLNVLDIDTNPEWIERYNECVPVIVINGKERFRGLVNPVLLRRILQSEGSKSSRRSR